ncbi:hypothetical protein JCM10213_002991 [Rhodosporidiobolus nylandii]
MAVRLPPELLLPILACLSPVDHARDAYYERQADLRACCLVSHTFRDLAQPLLERVVRLDTDHQVNAKQAGGRRRTMKRLVGTDSDGLTVERVLSGAANIAENVDDLRLSFFPGVPEYEELAWQQLELFSNLRHLHLLSGGILLSSAPTMDLPLVSLVLCEVWVGASVLADVLQPAITPSLRAVVLHEVYGESPSIAPGLLDRLEMLELDVDVYRSFPVASAALGVPILLSVNSLSDEYTAERTVVHNPLHLRLERLDGLLETLAVLSRLRTLVLPHKLDPSNGDVERNGGEDLTECDELLERDELLEACEQRGITVFWDDEAGEGEGEGMLSEAFWRYAQGFKADQQDE